MLSTHRTALLWPSATCTHCRVEERLLLVDGTGLMTPLEHTTHASVTKRARLAPESRPTGPRRARHARARPPTQKRQMTSAAQRGEEAPEKVEKAESSYGRGHHGRSGRWFRSGRLLSCRSTTVRLTEQGGVGEDGGRRLASLSVY